MKRYTAVDLFCGAGGLTLGFKQAEYKGYGFKAVAAVDVWKPACETYKTNHPEVEVICGDIRENWVKQRLATVTGGHVDVVIGGPPCEAFSLAGKRDPNDPRARLFYDYVDIVAKLQPYIFVMENVEGILTMLTLREDIDYETKRKVLDALNRLLELDKVGKARRAAPQYIIRENHARSSEEAELVKFVRKYLVTAAEAIRQAFNNIGYDVAWKVLNALDYGVPQERKRVFFIGAKKGLGVVIHFPERTHAPEESITIDGRKLERYRTLRDAIGDLPPLEQRPDDEVYEGGFSPIYMSRNRYKSWDEPSYTILASARHVPLHPDSPRMIKVDKDKWAFANEPGKKPRRLSVRECARVQTFPDWYKFVGSTVDKYALIGDAVPPLLAKRVAEATLRSLVEAGIEPSS
ncbi:MAG: DNA cytosine methyltransferase [Thermofilum sp.]|nr:DNA cytosine methyltransferase [Thermofilum sp.]